MKKLLSFALLAGLTLSACGTAPADKTGNGRVSLGIAAADAGSTVTVTRNYTPESVDDKGKVTPAKEEWTIGDAGPVTFTFMTRPGSDAVYIRGYRIIRYDYNGNVSTAISESRKLDIYVPSGYTCAERLAGSLPAYQSCPQFNANGSIKTDTVPANGLPITGLSIDFAGSLASEVRRTLASAYSTVDLEFFGDSSNGAPVSVTVKGIQSIAYKAGN